MTHRNQDGLAGRGPGFVGAGEEGTGRVEDGHQEDERHDDCHVDDVTVKAEGEQVLAVVVERIVLDEPNEHS